jgi:hypothetical protein
VYRWQLTVWQHGSAPIGGPNERPVPRAELLMRPPYARVDGIDVDALAGADPARGPEPLHNNQTVTP